MATNRRSAGDRRSFQLFQGPAYGGVSSQEAFVFRFYRFALQGALVVALISLAGCVTSGRKPATETEHQMVALLMPSRIEIVEPFTRVKSFDGDPVPDGIELLLQAVNALDNPGQMIAGELRAELYEHVPGSADPKGRRLENWTMYLTTTEQQKKHWNQLTQMYEFELGLDPDNPPPPAAKYVLSVTLVSAMEKRLFDEIVISRDTVGVPLKSPRAMRR